MARHLLMMNPFQLFPDLPSSFPFSMFCPGSHSICVASILACRLLGHVFRCPSKRGDLKKIDPGSKVNTELKWVPWNVVESKGQPDIASSSYTITALGLDTNLPPLFLIYVFINDKHLLSLSPLSMVMLNVNQIKIVCKHTKHRMLCAISYTAVCNFSSLKHAWLIHQMSRWWFSFVLLPSSQFILAVST